MPFPPRSWASIGPHVTGEVIANLSRRIIKGAPDECWPCTGLANRFGYAQVNLPGVYGPVGAHRIVFAEANPTMDIDTLYILHSCDNPPCCNPGHLRAGTHAENMRDAVNKGRTWAAKMTACKAGHSYADGNVVTTTGPKGQQYRKCLICSARAIATQRDQRMAAMRVKIATDDLPDLRAFAQRNLPVTFVGLSDEVGHRSALIVAYSFAAYCFPYRTLTDIGADFGITRERTRQLRQSALRSLRITEELPACIRSVARAEAWSHAPGRINDSTNSDLRSA